jgi:hypothetical protein
MKIEIERSGGFAGIIKTITINTENLPKYMATTLEDCLSETLTLKRPPNKMKSRVADCYSYKISSHRGNKKQQFEFKELDVDKELKSVVDYIFKNYPKCRFD